jgi:hypothetical protein
MSAAIVSIQLAALCSTVSRVDPAARARGVRFHLQFTDRPIMQTVLHIAN